MRLTLLLLATLLLFACEGAGSATPPPAATAPPGGVNEATPLPTPSPPPEPTPTTITLRVWGPPEGATGGGEPFGEQLGEQLAAFEAAHPDIHIEYERKATEGAASIAAYLRTAPSAAPLILPDLLLLPSATFDSVAQSQLLQPLDRLVSGETRADLYPFVTRDLRSDDEWVAVPLALSVTHGAVPAARRELAPPTLNALAAAGTPIWLVGAQPVGDGELADPLLLQMIALGEAMPGPTQLPPRERLLTLFETLANAIESGALPRTVLQQPNDDAALIAALRDGSAGLVQLRSTAYLAAGSEPPLAAVPIPTLDGRPAALVEGYLLAVTSSQARQQEAAGLLIDWLLLPENAATWGAVGWLPARRGALPAAVSDSEYRALLEAQLASGWFRPQGTNWADFARDAQTQFRALLSEQATPEQATEALYGRYGP